jgi:hypothetical protein
MARCFQGGLIVRNFCVERLCIRKRLCIHVCQIKPSTFSRAFEVIAFVPIFGTPPDQLGDLMAKGQALSPARGRLARRVRRKI